MLIYSPQKAFYSLCVTGQCLKNVGVQIGDSRDQFGRQRFIPYHVEEFYSGKGTNMDFLRQHDPDGLKLVWNLLTVVFYFYSTPYLVTGPWMLFRRSSDISLHFWSSNAGLSVSLVQFKNRQCHKNVNVNFVLHRVTSNSSFYAIHIVCTFIRKFFLQKESAWFYDHSAEPRNISHTWLSKNLRNVPDIMVGLFWSWTWNSPKFSCSLSCAEVAWAETVEQETWTGNSWRTHLDGQSWSLTKDAAGKCYPPLRRGRTRKWKRNLMIYCQVLNIRREYKWSKYRVARVRE